MQNVEWYVDWFNSPYYHLLYNHRNYEEANHFMEMLCDHLDLKPHAKIWDLACGKGRHAISLNKMGYDVTGTDLADNSIKEASKHINKTLEFEVHDMREPYRVNFFDAVFNLFTSIGYFKDENDNFLVFEHVAKSLKPGGEFVVDFFNAEKVRRTYIKEYTEHREKLDFKIKKRIEDHKIIKRIEFSDKGKQYFFEESVALLEKKDFESFAQKAGLQIMSVFGSYHLEPFHHQTSDRLVLVFKK
jgi:ubiquinone/menaquinone biosynthesis C-methylase UbiE